MSTSESIPSAPERGQSAITSSKFVSPPAPTSLALVPSADAFGQQFGSTATHAGGLSGFMHAFRRVWLLALSVSVVCGATAAALQWFFWKPEYVAAAYLRVASSQPIVMFNTKDNAAQANYEVYKRTQKELIRNRYVLNSALRDPKVSQMPVIKHQVNPVDWLQDQILVTYPGEAEILEISLRGESPDAVAALVNAVCKAYVEGVVNAERNDRLLRLQNLEKIFNDTEEKVRQKRAHLNELVDSLGTGNSQTATQKQQIALDSYGTMRKEQLTNQISLMHAQSKLKAQQGRVESLGQEPVPAEALEAKILTNPDYHAVAQRIESIQEVLNTSKTVANEGHQDVERLFDKHRRDLADAQKKLEEVRQRVQPLIETEVRKQLIAQAKTDLQKTQLDVETFKEQADQLGKEVDKFGKESHQIGRSSVDLEMMKADVDNVEKISKEMANEIETLRVELASASRVEVISLADVPRVRDEKSHLRQAEIYGGVFFFVPLLGICWWDARRKKLNTVDEVASSMRLHLIGSLPLLPSRIHRRLSNGSAHSDWSRLLSEAVDSIREMLISEARIRPAKVVIITSAMVGEGKTTVATQLAMSFARANKRTVIVDFDLRRPATHVALGKPSELGIAEALRGTKSVDQVVFPTEWPNLFHMPVGQLDGNSPKLICSRKDVVEAIFTHLREQFDIVIVDSCPVLPVVDTLVVGQFADIALLSMMRDVSESQQVHEAQERLKHIGISVLGAVVTSKGTGVYSSYYYSPYTQNE